MFIKLLEATKHCVANVWDVEAAEDLNSLDTSQQQKEPDRLAGYNEGVQLVDSSSYTSCSTCVPSLERTALLEHRLHCR